MRRKALLGIILLGLSFFCFCSSVNQVNADVLRDFSAGVQRVYFYKITDVENNQGESLLESFELTVMQPNYTLTLEGATLKPGKILSLEIYRSENTVGAFITIDRIEYGGQLIRTGWSGTVVPTGVRVDPFFFRRGAWDTYESELNELSSVDVVVEETEKEFKYTITDTANGRKDILVYLLDGTLISYSGIRGDWKLSFELEGTTQGLHGLMGIEILWLIPIVIAITLIVLFIIKEDLLNEIKEGVSKSFKVIIFGYQEYDELSKRQSSLHVTLFVIFGISLAALSRSFPLSWVTLFPFWIWISFFNYFLYEAFRAVIWIGLAAIMIIIINPESTLRKDPKGDLKRDLKGDLKKATFRASYTYGYILFIFNAIVYLVFVNTYSPGGNPYGPIIIQYMNPTATIWILMCAFYQIRSTGVPKITADKAYNLGREAEKQYAFTKTKATVGAFLWLIIIIGVHFVIFPEYFSPATFAEFIQLN